MHFHVSWWEEFVHENTQSTNAHVLEQVHADDPATCKSVRLKRTEGDKPLGFDPRISVAAPQTRLLFFSRDAFPILSRDPSF